MDIGYDRPLYVLPFDHRASFEKGLFGFSPPLTAEQAARVAASKQVIYDGLKLALTRGRRARRGHPGRRAIRRRDPARRTRERPDHLRPREKSGQEEFQFEYGDRYAEDIAELNP